MENLIASKTFVVFQLFQLFTAGFKPQWVVIHWQWQTA